jgi:hypothetical protein
MSTRPNLIAYKPLIAATPTSMEFLDPYGKTRSTGMLGTGTYVLLHSTGNDHKLQRPWNNPWIIRTLAEFEELYNFSRDLRNVFYNGTSVAAVAKNHSVFLRRMLGASHGRPTQVHLKNLLCHALALSDESMGWNAALHRALGIQPINFVLMHAGYDGIVNEVMDNSVHGSIIFKSVDVWARRAAAIKLDETAAKCRYYAGHLLRKHPQP